MQEIKIECPSCHGTGLYVGCAERKGAAVICNSCKGTGMIIYKYTPFTHRKLRDDVKRVFKTGGGFVISAEDVITKENKLLPFSTAGCTYEEWLNGVDPKHIEFIVCPLRIDQATCHRLPGFINKCHELHGGWIGNINNCKYQSNRSECWKRFNSQSKIK